MRTDYRTRSGNMALKPGDIVVRVRRTQGSQGRIVTREWVRVDRLLPEYRAIVVPCDEQGNLTGAKSYRIARRNLVPGNSSA